MAALRTFVIVTVILLLVPSSSKSGEPGAMEQGQWDGVTPSSPLDGPYTNLIEAKIPFGMTSYYMQPWRSYMDTWSAKQYAGCFGAVYNVDPKYSDALGQVLSESGIRTIRIEIGWGSLDWNDQIPGNVRQREQPIFDMCRKYGIRPLILLNAHHGDPCPSRPVMVNLVAPALKGDTILKLALGTVVHEGYTGVHDIHNIAAYPLITKIDPDGTAHLSAALGEDFNAGPLQLTELKYQPFQGDQLADGTPVPACQQTFDGWVKYVAAVAAYVQDALGTRGKADAGFDFEVWNELGFGSDFLNIANYYSVKPQYKMYDNKGSDYVYKTVRPHTAALLPDAQTNFSASNAFAILPMTIDYMHSHGDDFPGVKVVNGFSNERPWDSGSSLWPNQAGFSRHGYTGGWKDISPTSAPNIQKNGEETGVIDALGNFEGAYDNKNPTSVAPGSVFIPSFTMGYPEYLFSGFLTESLSRDVVPDSRFSGFEGHGRYTNNGDLHPAELWETETNYWREQLFRDIIFKQPSITPSDPQAIALDEHLAAKYMLRQYIFLNHKGLKRVYMYCLGSDPFVFGMFPKRFYDELDASNGVLTPQARAAVPQGFSGLAWFAKKMDAAEPIDAPRPLNVTNLVEYKPRLVFAGDNTTANPSTWNRDWFTFLPYQLSSNRYLIPYYVQTINQGQVWDSTKPLLDPARWDMPAQNYDITISNVCGTNASVSALDPMTMQSVPVTMISSSSTSITLRLSTVDYPRFLSINENNEGPLVVKPRVELTGNQQILVIWKTNIPANITISYGPGWENRSATTVKVAAGDGEYVFTPPNKGDVAVRVTANARGLTDMWPRWDEDPQGQIVVP